MKLSRLLNGRVRNAQRNDRNGSRANSAQPDFLCVGVHKGGTTWLYQQLDAHPDFWMPPLKELHYFDQLGRVQRASTPRCRDERDARFLESIKSLSAKPYLDFEHYAHLFQSKGFAELLDAEYGDCPPYRQVFSAIEGDFYGA